VKPHLKKPLSLSKSGSSPANDNIKPNERSAELMPASTPKSAANPLDRRRRRHPRHRADFRVSVNHLLGSHYQRVKGHCKDVSEAGIGVLLAAELNVGEVASLGFSLSASSGPWDVRAVVRYRRGYHYGFEFLSLTVEQAEQLKDYLKGQEQID
jgi:hypothetical protein